MSETCNDCHQPYADVYWIDDELWARLHERAPAGLLCPSCLVRRALAKGRDEAELKGHGYQRVAATCEHGYNGWHRIGEGFPPEVCHGGRPCH